MDRYQTETKRLYAVLETRLASQLANNRTADPHTKASHAGPEGLIHKNEEPGAEGPWLVGDKCTVADLACFSWVNWAEWAGLDVGAGEFEQVKGWVGRINEREGVKRGVDVPEPFEMKKKMESKV